MKLRRGFIKEAEELAMSFRQGLGVSASDPLCVLALCEWLEIPLHRLSDIKGLSNDIKVRLLGTGAADTKFFAVTMKPNGISEILYNDFVSSNRQRSDIAHEVAHIVLGHKPSIITSEKGCRAYNAELEREAHELGYTILVPKFSALSAVENFNRREDAAKHFQVSKSLMEYRIRKSGADGWAYNRRKKRVQGR